MILAFSFILAISWLCVGTVTPYSHGTTQPSLPLHTQPQFPPGPCPSPLPPDTQCPLAAQDRVSLSRGASGSTPVPSCVGFSAPRTPQSYCSTAGLSLPESDTRWPDGQMTRWPAAEEAFWRRAPVQLGEEAASLRDHGRNLQTHAVVEKRLRCSVKL